MPNTDSCEPQVIRALDKAGWGVDRKPVTLRLGRNIKRSVYADLRLRHKRLKKRIIVVEVKCFPEHRSVLDEFYHAVGQYLVYRNAIQLRRQRVPVYLVIPIQAYSELIGLEAVQNTIAEVKIKIITIDLVTETVISWIN